MLLSPLEGRWTLPGPSGESNTLDYRPRGRVLCTAAERGALWEQLAAVLATGNRALVLGRTGTAESLATLPPTVLARIDACSGLDELSFEAVLHPGPAAASCPVPGGGDAHWLAWRRALAARPGARLALVVPGAEGYELARLVAERVVSTNTAAAGGNASLLSL